jgi:hypothetical protein
MPTERVNPNKVKHESEHMTVTPAYIVTGGGPDNSLPGVPPGIDNSLPGSPPGIDNSLPRHTRPVDPGYGIPLPPVTVWPTPPTIGYPLPIPPTYPVPPDYIDNLPPMPPTVWPTPPVPPTTWPPPQPIRPGVPVYPALPIAPGGERPSTGPVPEPPGGVVSPPIAPGGDVPGMPLPMPPGAVWPPLPGVEGKVIAFVWFVGYGWRWGSFDPSLTVGYPLPAPPGGVIDNTLPPYAQPRR